MAEKKELENLDFKDAANKIWMAGIGALRVAEEEGSRLFKSLVDKGSDFQSSSKDVSQKQLEKFGSIIKDSMGTFKERIDSIAGREGSMLDRFNLEEIFTSTLKKFGVATQSEIEALSKKITDLEKAVRDLKK